MKQRLQELKLKKSNKNDNKTKYMNYIQIYKMFRAEKSAVVSIADFSAQTILILVSALTLMLVEPDPL